jgi:hypothetical protein
MFRGRTDEELIHFVRNGYFLTHTPDQAEAERQAIKIEAAQKKWGNEGGEGREKPATRQGVSRKLGDLL